MTVAFALVASAAAWRQCSALQMAAAAVSIERGSHGADRHGQATSYGEHDHHAMHQQHVADDLAADVTKSAPPVADDHGCMKCCSMCTVANALLPAADTAVIFAVSSPVFSGDDETWTANLITVDPGIPKRIV